jgi:hypothetical protein
MPISAGQSDPTTDATPSSITIAPTAPASAAALDVGGFKNRVVGAAQTVRTGTFVLVIKTGMIGGDLTLKYNGAYDVTDSTTPRCRLDGTQNGQPLTVIVVGDKLYTKAGTGKYGLSSVSASVAKLGLVTVRPDLPTLVELVGSSVRSLTDVGPDVVNGLTVEHWRAMVDASVFAPDAAGITPVDVWLDSTDLLRQVSYSLTSGGIASTTTSVTVTYGDFDSAVTIDEPAPSEVR